MNVAVMLTTRSGVGYFTGKDRDAESGLDNFGARYNSSATGRFMSPDWSAAPTGVPYANAANPQSLNLYGYEQNNPVTTTDSDGHGGGGTTWSDIWNAGAALWNAGATILAGGSTAVTIGAGGIIVGAEIEAFDLAITNPHEPCSCAVDAVDPPYISAPAKNENNAEQGRGPDGKFIPTEPGQAQPGSTAEKDGLAALGATKNTQKIPGTNVIPDGTMPDGQKVEIKSGDVLANTGQLREMGQGAMDTTGKPLVVGTTNPNVKVTKNAKANGNLDIRPCQSPSSGCPQNANMGESPP